MFIFTELFAKSKTAFLKGDLANYGMQKTAEFKEL